MATDPRPARSQSAYSNTPAKLPSLPTVRVTDPQMQRFIEALRIWIDARSGARDIFEKAVTMRDLVQLGLIDGSVLARGWGVGAAPGPNVVVETPTTTLTMSNEAFANSIINTRLFQELMRRLDDPARFDALPEEIRSRLLVDIAAEAEKRGADIRRIEEKIQTQEKSMAVAIDEVAAAVDNSVAGVRQSVFAYADENRAVAGSVTQIKARIDGVPIPVDQIDTTVYASLAALELAKPVGVRGIYYQVDDPASTDNILYQWNGTAYYIAGHGTTAYAAATIEEQMTAIADRAQGLEAQYTLKLQAGNKVAGFGLAATDNTTDGATSAFIVSADKFAIVDAADNIPNPLSPPLKRVPFGVDTVNDVIYINGQVRINAGGTALSDIVTQSYALRIDLSNEQFQVATDKDGNNGVFGAQAESDLAIYRGTNVETVYWAFSITVANCTAQLWNGSAWVAGPISGVSAPKVRVTGMSADNCVVTITATRAGSPNLTTEFTGSKVKAGLDGTPATTRFISSTAGAIKRTEAGVAVPASVTFNAYSQTGSGVPSAYSGRIRASYSVAATPTSFTTITPDPTVDASSRTVTVPSDAVYVRGELFAAGGFTSSLDRETIPVIADGPTGATGARGSLTGYGANYGIYVPTTAWDDYKANRVINNMITGESLTTNLTTTTHLRAGDTVTLTDAAGTNATKAVTKYWSVASGWLAPGVVIDGNLLVNGTITTDKLGAEQVTAAKIDSKNLTIKDSAGNVIFSASQNLSYQRVAGLGDLATKSTITSSYVTDLGGLATQNSVFIGSTVKFADGTVMNAGDFVNKLSKITDTNVSTFISSAAIGEAYIGNLSAAKITSGFLSSDRIEAGSITATKIDTTGLEIKDAKGNVILRSGNSPINAFSSFTSVRRADFSNSTQDFVFGNLNYTLYAGYIRLTPTANYPNWLTPSGLKIDGRKYDKIQMRIRRVSGTGWQGVVYYDNVTHSYSGSYYKQIADGTIIGQWVILEWDMAALTLGGTDWTSSPNINAIRFDLANTPSDVFEVDWISVGRYFGGGIDQVTPENASTFIADLSVNTLQIAGNAVTFPIGAQRSTDTSDLTTSNQNVLTASVDSKGAPIYVVAKVLTQWLEGAGIYLDLYVNDVLEASESVGDVNSFWDNSASGKKTVMFHFYKDTTPSSSAFNVQIRARKTGISQAYIKASSNLFVIATKK